MRIKTFTATAAIALSVFAGAATAQSVNPGKQQLADELGVEVTDFTTAQLITLEGAVRENDDEMIRFILSKAGGVTARADFSDGVVTAGDVQLARIAGVEPGRYTTEELVRLKAAQDNNEDETIAFILSGETREVRGGQPGRVHAGRTGCSPAAEKRYGKLIPTHRDVWKKTRGHPRVFLHLVGQNYVHSSTLDI